MRLLLLVDNAQGGGCNENARTNYSSNRARRNFGHGWLGGRESTDVRAYFRVDRKCARWRDDHSMRQGLQTGLGGTRGKSQCHTISEVYLFMHGAPLFVWSGWGLARIKQPNSSLLTVPSPIGRKAAVTGKCAVAGLKRQVYDNLSRELADSLYVRNHAGRSCAHYPRRQ
jgi:hypothetical protein